MTDAPRLVWWSGLLAFFLLAAAWAVSTPYDGAYDEHDHVVRAAGVVRGQLLVAPSDAQNGRYQNVPRSLVPPNFDCLRAGTASARCLGDPPDDRTRARVRTRAGHYNPVYYVVVGWPLGPWPTMTGVILARLVNALLCAMLLALAVVTAWPRRGHRLLVLGVLLCATPTVLSLAGLLNPSGLEICAAVLLWTTLARLATDGTDATGAATGRLVVRAGVAAVTLALVRPAGLVILGAVAALVWFALGDRSRLRALASRRDVRIATAVTAAAGVLVLVWTLVAQIGAVGTEAPADPRSWASIVRGIVLSRLDYWVRQTIGVFGYGTIALPVWLVLAWGAVQALLVLAGHALAPRRHAWTIAAIPVACLLGGAAAELLTARVIGAFMQGRYFLPVWVGMFVLAALAVPTGPTTPVAVAVRRIYRAFALVWALAMPVALYVAARRFQHGQSGQLTGAESWRPTVGPAVPYVLLAAGLVATGILLWPYLRAGSVQPSGALPLSRARSR